MLLIVTHKLLNIQWSIYMYPLIYWYFIQIANSLFLCCHRKKELFFSHSSGWEQKKKRQNRYRVHMRAVIAHIIVLCASYSHLYFLFYPQMDYRWIFECGGKNLFFAINLRNNFHNSADPWDGFLGRGAVWIFLQNFNFFRGLHRQFWRGEVYFFLSDIILN